MTPELRAARDSLGAALAAWDEHAHPAEIDIITSVYGKEPGVYFPIRASSLRAVLAALDDEPVGFIEFPADVPAADMERFASAWDAAQGPERTLTLDLGNRTATFKAKPYPADWSDGPRGQCEGCGCCVASGCHRFADATCPTNSLGDSVCPCTED